MKTNYYAVRYTWKKGKRTERGHSVASGPNKAAAIARFQHANRHVRVLKR